MTTRKNSKVTKLLIAARKKISDPNNWCKNTFRDKNRYCAVGAVDACGSLTNYWSSAMQALIYVIGQNIVIFNDAPSTTHDDVLRAFDLAIAISEYGF